MTVGHGKIIRAPSSRQEVQALGWGIRMQAPPTSKEARSVKVSGPAPYSHCTLWEASKSCLVLTLDPGPKGRKVPSGETCFDICFSKADFSHTPPPSSREEQLPLGPINRCPRGGAEEGMQRADSSSVWTGQEGGSAGRGLTLQWRPHRGWSPMFPHEV